MPTTGSPRFRPPPRCAGRRPPTSRTPHVIAVGIDRYEDAVFRRLSLAVADAKAFGAEDREEQRLSGVVGKWRSRTARTWRRGTLNGGIQGAMMIVIRTMACPAVILPAKTRPMAVMPRYSS